MKQVDFKWKLILHEVEQAAKSLFPNFVNIGQSDEIIFSIISDFSFTLCIGIIHLIEYNKTCIAE